MRRLALWAWGIYRYLVGRPVHCWRDKASWAEEKYGWGSDEWAISYMHNGTCMRLHGHFGAHIWVPDEKVVVRFQPQGHKLPPGGL